MTKKNVFPAAKMHLPAINLYPDLTGINRRRFINPHFSVPTILLKLI